MSSPQQNEQRRQGRFVPFLKVIVFPQVRQTFDRGELILLAKDIAIHGLIYPCVVARLSPEYFLNYKKVFEEISGVTLDREFPYTIEDGERWYYVLIAGERRYRAHHILWHEGCDECQALATAEHRKLHPGECFIKHMKRDEIEVRACTNEDPVSAKSMQFRENNYIKPPLHEEAHAYEQYFRYLQKQDEHITISAFARIVGVSVEKIRKALWFCNLPIAVQDAVRSGYITYSHALEIRRLIEATPQDRREKTAQMELEWLLMKPKFKLEDYHKRISNKIEELNMTTLFSLEDLVMTPQAKRKVVAKELLPLLGVGARYTEKFLMLVRQGIVGKDKTYSEISPNFQLKRMLLMLYEAAPELFDLDKEEQTEEVRLLGNIKLDKVKQVKFKRSA